jgi:predicted RNase H-like HicB family nuclease
VEWRIVLEQDPETGEWASWCPELTGCASAGLTRAEALSGIREAISLDLAPADVELPPGCELRTQPT